VRRALRPCKTGLQVDCQQIDDCPSVQPFQTHPSRHPANWAKPFRTRVGLTLLEYD
jgi:hypothetical protein